MDTVICHTNPFFWSNETAFHKLFPGPEHFNSFWFALLSFYLIHFSDMLEIPQFLSMSVLHLTSIFPLRNLFHTQSFNLSTDGVDSKFYLQCIHLFGILFECQSLSMDWKLHEAGMLYIFPIIFMPDMKRCCMNICWLTSKWMQLKTFCWKFPEFFCSTWFHMKLWIYRVSLCVFFLVTSRIFEIKLDR